MDYRFNVYRVSGEDAQVWSEKAYKLLRSGRGYFSGFELGEILYKANVKGLPAKEINKDYSHIPYQTVRTIISGKFSPDTYIIFMDMLETEKEMLATLFQLD